MKKFELKPFDKVLVRGADDHHWKCDLFSHYEEYSQQYVCIGSWYKQCIPFEGNEKMLGTADPHVEPYEPKDGDFVTYMYSNGNKYVAIFQCTDNNLVDCYYVDLRLDNKDKECIGSLTYDDGFDTDYTERRQSTEEEKQLLINALHKEGKDWDAEKKEIVDWKWKPKRGESYWTLDFSCNGFEPTSISCNNDEEDQRFYDKGLVCKTEKEADKLATELNEKLFGKEK